MAKVKTTFFCQSCGAQSAKWQGQCTSCKSWNTITEEFVQKPDKKDWKTGNQSAPNRVSKPLKISEIDTTKTVRMDTADGELNRVLGGGIVPGSLTLLGGEPGHRKKHPHASSIFEITLQNTVCFWRRKSKTN